MPYNLILLEQFMILSYQKMILIISLTIYSFKVVAMPTVSIGILNSILYKTPDRFSFSFTKDKVHIYSCEAPHPEFIGCFNVGNILELGTKSFNKGSI